jgi:large subunit ribosomal protein L10
MLRQDKERVVAALVERLRTSDTLIVADYRGLTMKELDRLRGELLKHGARFSVVKNTLTRRAAEAAGVEVLNEFLDGPTAIAFVSGGDAVAVARTLHESARKTRILQLRGGILDGRPISGDQVRELATLPPPDVLRGQTLGLIVAPLGAVAGLLAAPLRDLVGVLDARARQLEERGDVSAVAEPSAPAEPPGAAEEPAAQAEEAEGVETEAPGAEAEAGSENENPTTEDQEA